MFFRVKKADFHPENIFLGRVKKKLTQILTWFGFLVQKKGKIVYVISPYKKKLKYRAEVGRADLGRPG